MRAEIYLGGFGTGKTAALYEKIKLLAEKGEKCLLFVPEQFSFDAERAIYFAVGARNLQYVKVTGFSKLSREILKQYKKAKPVADNAVKLITMWKAVESVRDELVCYNKTAAAPGFCRLMLKTVAAFRNAGISPEDYKKMLTDEENLPVDLGEKAEDFLKIYSRYHTDLTENLDDKLDDVSRAALLAREHDFFKGTNLFFDNFDSFSAVQQKLLSAAADSCRSITVCLASDMKESNAPSFLCITKTVNDIKNIVPSLTFKEFKTPYRAKGREENPVELYSAKTPYEEARLAAAKIHKLVMEQNYRYRDILVLTADSIYQPILAEEFGKSEIPCFCDFPHPMTEKPVVGFVLQILKSLTFDTKELLKLIESGFKRIISDKDGFNRLLSGSEIYRIGAAVSSYKITAEDWEKDWSRDVRTMLNPLEELRKAVILPLKELKEKLIAASDGAELSAVFMSYLLEQEGLKSTFIARSKTGGGEGTDYIEVDENAAEEHLRIWDALCEAFTSMAYCLKGEKIGCDRYCALLEEILAGINLSNPPMVLDSVTVGDIERTRKASPKAVFILGAGQGAIPRKTELQSIFNYRERECLNTAGINLYDTNLNRWSKEQYFAARAMELYGKRLIITYPRQSTDGRETLPSPILEGVGVKAVPCEDLPLDFFLNTAYDVKTALSEAYGNYPELAEGLQRLIDDSDFEERLSDSLSYLTGGRVYSLAPDTAKRLLTLKSYSPTSLNSAFQCPFKFFCEYGLKLKQREENDITASSNIGTSIHNIMCRVLTWGIKDRSCEEIEEYAKAALEQEIDRVAETDPSNAHRIRGIYGSLYGRLVPLLMQAKTDIEISGYEPAEFEKKVSYTVEDINLPGGFAEISGTADRTDILKQGDKSYVRVLDYKTGKAKSFSATGVEYGIDLQPLLYLFAQTGDNLPAGVGYFNSGEASAESFDDETQITPKEEARAWYEKHPISGAIFNTPPVAEAEEKFEKHQRIQTGARSKSYNHLILLSPDKYSELRDYVNKEIILPKIHSLLNGEIDDLPLDMSSVDKGAYSPCGFCQYRTLCGNKEFKVKIPDKDKSLTKFQAVPEKKTKKKDNNKKEA